MTNQLALWMALLILGAIGWDFFLNDAYWLTTWGRRLVLIIDWARFW